MRIRSEFSAFAISVCITTLLVLLACYITSCFKWNLGMLQMYALEQFCSRIAAIAFYGSLVACLSGYLIARLFRWAAPLPSQTALNWFGGVMLLVVLVSSITLFTHKKIAVRIMETQPQARSHANEDWHNEGSSAFEAILRHNIRRHISWTMLGVLLVVGNLIAQNRGKPLQSPDDAGNVDGDDARVSGAPRAQQRIVGALHCHKLETFHC